MIVFVFGNPDLREDALPLRILPRLAKCFPSICFKVLDPNEEWRVPNEVTLIDTVRNIRKVRLFSDIRDFRKNLPRVTLHDFDMLIHLWLLTKLGKLTAIKIIGVPPTISEDEALTAVAAILRANLP